MSNFRTFWRFGMAVAFTASFALSAVAQAEQPPSVEQIYAMLQNQQRQIDALESNQSRLQTEARQARSEAERAKAELASAKRQFERAQSASTANDAPIVTASLALPPYRLAGSPGFRGTSAALNPGQQWFSDVSLGAVFVGDDGHGFVFLDDDANSLANGHSGTLRATTDDEVGY